ncbi:MAG: haloalkane dehalogenase [Deltaproteobacteria bacterium]|nr:MAG: haloalkane dehalogenase [Deltaproteobacteria bacterium]
MTKIIRTPDKCFDALPGYTFTPHYQELPDRNFGSLRMHYVDEGPRDGAIILLLHGQGCWSYIFRDMIPVLTAAGFRVIAPDFIGFGRSDKLPSTDDYTFEHHVDWLTAFFQAMNFDGITAYLFDWGGYFGLRIAAKHPHFFGRIALSNTQLPIGDSPGRDWFIKWRTEQFALPKFPQGEMVNDGCRKKLSAETIAAFDAPYVDESYKTGPRRFPMILPISPDMESVPENRAAWDALADWQKPMLTLFSADFKGTAMGPEKLLNHIPGTQGQAHELLENAGFYIVEDKATKLAGSLLRFADKSGS